MHHSFSDEFAGLDSLLSRLPARLKILFCLVFVILIALTPISMRYAFAAYAIFLALLMFASKIPLRFFLQRLFTILPFIVLFALSIPFIQDNGWTIFASCLTKAILIILSLILLMQTTRFRSLLTELGKLRVPGLIIMLLSFMYRYLFVVEDEILRKKRALDLRSSGRRNWAVMKSTANMLGSLFIQTYERAERIYLAMCARGYESREREQDK
ncbi:energy-coupling factor transporter transmembrane component T family protein [Candidatus Omnitrophota bacterium]